jgi:choline dehydrogenase-like flavoprotein
LLTIKEGINALKRFFAAPAWKDYQLSIQSDFPEEDEGALDEYIRNITDHAAHPVGTASMSAKGAKNGVVDPDLKLKKAAGLRVVDASVMVST